MNEPTLLWDSPIAWLVLGMVLGAMLTSVMMLMVSRKNRCPTCYGLGMVLRREPGPPRPRPKPLGRKLSGSGTEESEKWVLLGGHWHHLIQRGPCFHTRCGIFIHDGDEITIASAPERATGACLACLR